MCYFDSLVPQQKSQCSPQLLTCRRLEIFCGTKLYGQALRHLLQKLRLFFCVAKFTVPSVSTRSVVLFTKMDLCLKPSKLSDNCGIYITIFSPVSIYNASVFSQGKAYSMLAVVVNFYILQKAKVHLFS